MSQSSSTAAPVDFLTSLRVDSLRRHIQFGMKSLEIGAFTRPTLMQPDFQASFLDFYSTEELKEQCLRIGIDQGLGVPVEFIVKGEDYTPFIDRHFDVVIANHVLEHIRNPIRWLLMISEIVSDDGILFISLPDKRQSFDKFRDETSLSHILSDYMIEGRDLEAEHCIETEIFYDRRYINQERSLEISLSLDRIKHASRHFHPGIHCHVFNGDNFLNKILKPIIYMKLIPWNIVDFIQEDRAGEFYIILRKGSPETDLSVGDFFGER